MRLLAADSLRMLPSYEGRQSVLDPAGPLAGRVEDLWWFMFAASAAVFALVLAALLYATFRRRGETAGEEFLRPGPAPAPAQRAMLRAVVSAVAATAVILAVLLVLDFSVGRAMTGVPSPKPLTVEVTGHQWWWEVHYDAPGPSERVETANEIHVPVGRPVLFRLTSRDVIHSFWVPNLNGKTDLIPGYVTTTWFQADTPGVYRAQCAEYCGHQHAKMAFIVVAEPPAEFEAWLARQRRPAPPPSDSLQARGQRVFLGGSCAMCHAIQGTPAGSRVGPNLTHVASRRTIAAGTLPNTRGHLAGWVLDPQRIKPGVRMPPNQLGSEDLEALLSYLESLK